MSTLISSVESHLPTLSSDIQSIVTNDISLLTSGAPPTDDWKILEDACEKGSNGFLKIVFEANFIDLTTEAAQKNQLYQKAILSPMPLSTLQVLFDHKVPGLEAADGQDGNTPLMNAASLNKIDVAKFLIEKGANPLCRNTSGRCLIHCGVDCDNTEIIDWSMQFGIPVDTPSNFGNTPFLYAIAWGKYNTARHLYDQYKANPDLLTANDQTIMHKAAHSNSAEVLDWVVSLGYSVELRNAHGNTPLHHATLLADHVSAKLLVEKYNADIHAVNKTNQTLMHKAAESDDKATIQWVVSLGLVLNPFDDNGLTPLFYAKKLNKHVAAQYLKEIGAL